MNKIAINTLIRNMQQAGIVTKATPWGFEGVGEKQLQVRYVGIKLADWADIFSEKNNVLLKFTLDKTTGFMEFFLANKPPFVRVTGTKLTETSKWETLLGDIKRQLAKDKQDFLHHKDRLGNLYTLIEKHLK